MAGYKAPDFNQRAALAREAKQKALEQLKAKPPVDEAVVAQRKQAQLAKEAAAAEKRQAKREAEERAKQEKREAEEALALARAAATPRQPTEAERKAARDARYAARKNAKK